MFGPSLLLATACVPEGGTIQALVDARAEQLAEDARMASRLAIASGGLSAQMAPLSLDDWADLTELQLAPEVAEVLGVEQAGYVQANRDTGAVRITWTDAEFSPDIVGKFHIDVLRAQNHFVVGFDQNPGEPPGVHGEANVTVEGNGQADPMLRVDFDLRVGSTSQHVDLPARPDPDENDEIDHPVWPEGGAFLPLSGDFRWTRTKKGKAQEINSLGTEDIDGLAWPVIAASEDWEHLVQVDLARDEGDSGQ